MGPKADQESEGAKFQRWDSPDLADAAFDIGEIRYGRDGKLWIELRTLDVKSLFAHWIFDAPLAIRIAGEGSMMTYWRAGFRVGGYNLFVAAGSEFIEWLERSSAGVHSRDHVRHYAAFSDDVCIEVLAAAAPRVQLAQ